jgi:hypothetical protein
VSDIKAFRAFLSICLNFCYGDKPHASMYRESLVSLHSGSILKLGLVGSRPFNRKISTLGAEYELGQDTCCRWYTALYNTILDVCVTSIAINTLRSVKKALQCQTNIEPWIWYSVTTFLCLRHLCGSSKSRTCKRQAYTSSQLIRLEAIPDIKVWMTAYQSPHPYLRTHTQLQLKWHVLAGLCQ